jgi:microcystin-dependent protein
MSDQFLGEIRMFPFNFPPANWMFCDGQLLPISQYSALFSLLGTQFGGNGQSNFALPDLQGRAAVDSGQGVGLSEVFVGQQGGESTVTLLTSQMPVHNHPANCYGHDGNSYGPANNIWAQDAGGNQEYGTTPAPAGSNMAPGALTQAGGSQPHNNLQPYLTLNFCIAMVGEFPARS